MNKFERRVKGMFKFKKRLKLWYPCSEQRNNQHYTLKTTSTPCSCYMCSGESYSRKIKHKNKDE